MEQEVSLEQMVQAMAERRMELEELGPIIDRRCRVVQVLIASMQRDISGEDHDHTHVVSPFKHELERQERELLRLLEREWKLRNADSASGESPK